MIEYAYRSSYFRYELEEAGAIQSYIAGFWLTEGEDDDEFLGLMADADKIGLRIGFSKTPFSLNDLRQMVYDFAISMMHERQFKKFADIIIHKRIQEKKERLEQEWIRDQFDTRNHALLQKIEVRAIAGIIALEQSDGDYPLFAHCYAHNHFEQPRRGGDALSIPRKLNRKLEELIKDK